MDFQSEVCDNCKQFKPHKKENRFFDGVCKLLNKPSSKGLRPPLEAHVEKDCFCDDFEWK